MPPQTAQDKLIERWLKSDKSVNPFSPKTWEWINAGLALVLKKIMAGAAALIQAPFVAGLTLADKIAWVLRKGIDMSKDAGSWVFHLMRKMMQALGMKVVKTVAELTRQFMQHILLQLIERITAEAQRAIRQILRN